MFQILLRRDLAPYFSQPKSDFFAMRKALTREMSMTLTSVEKDRTWYHKAQLDSLNRTIFQIDQQLHILRDSRSLYDERRRQVKAEIKEILTSNRKYLPSLHG
ncbi:hypothetical protein ES703_46960 [subsurface metagenome]